MDAVSKSAASKGAAALSGAASSNSAAVPVPSVPVGRRFTDRSAQSREAILAAARARFAADGYEKTTIRAIAADAGIDASMVIRYYGSKAELFEASAAVLLLISPSPNAEPEQLAAEYARAFIERWQSGANEVEQLLLRTALTHKEAVGMVQRIFDEQIKPPIATSLADDPEAELRAALVMSQTVGLAVCRYLLGLEPISSADPDVLERALRDVIRLNLTRPLHGD